MPELLTATAVLEHLYPDADVTYPARPVSGAGFLGVPFGEDARFLLPAGRAVSAAALRHSRRPLDVRSRMKSAAVVAALRTGIVRRATSGWEVRPSASGDSINTLLAEVVGRPVVIGIALGPHRANRKPVLQVLTEDGELLAIAKVGLNPLTRSLAVTESAALTMLGQNPPTSFEAPEQLHFGYWNGHTVLVQSALGLLGAPTKIDPVVRDAAMCELARIEGVRSTTWRESKYAQRLATRNAARDDTRLADSIRQAIAGLMQSDKAVLFGAWHGDWTAWNMAVRSGRALVWDWERFEVDVPLGFDALHYAFMRLLRSSPTPETAGTDLVERSGRLVRPFGVPEADGEQIALAYLLDLATRYLADGQEDFGAQGGKVGAWLMPVLDRTRNGKSLRTVGGTHG